MTYECGACGGKFEDRLDHAATCAGPFPEEWWGEGDGDVLWWCWRDGEWLGEPPYVGSPLDLGLTVECHTHAENGETPAARFQVGGWPGYHTHWTRLPPQPPAPQD